jgi:D-galactarolactone cycloisomerase
LKIRAIEVLGLAHRLAAGKAYGSARALQPRRVSTLVRVRTEEGVDGVGESQAPYPLVRAQLDLWRPYFVGADIHDRDAIFLGLLNRSYHMGLHGPLIASYSGLNIAMLDALGKALGVPVCKLIGGTARTEVKAYATGVYITEQPERDLAPQLEAIRSQGFSAAKIKIGLGPRSDEARTAAARRALGDDTLLMVDANGNYTVDLALESMRRIAGQGIHWYEEPLPPQDYAGYRDLRPRAPVALSAGEAHYMAYDFQRLLEGRCIDVAQPTVAACGGLDEARRIADLCRLHNVRVVPAAWGSGVGLAAALHFAASLPSHPHSVAAPVPQMVEYDVGENALRDELLAEPLRPKQGVLALPQAPGLGITLDESALKRFASPD